VRPRGCRAGAAVLIAAFALGPALPLAAEPDATQRETARTLMWSGDKLFEKGSHAEALQAYRAADAIMNVPTTGLAVARAHEALGQLVEARERALRVERSQPTPEESPILSEARKAAAKLASSLAERIPKIIVTVEGVAPGDAYEVTIDDASVPPADAASGWPVNPNAHTVVVRAKGYADETRNLTVEERASSNVRITLRSSREPSSSAGAGWVLVYSGFSIGGAALTVGGITGGVSIAETDALLERCGGPRCDESAADDLSSATTLANVSNGAFVVGGVGLVLGIVGVVLVATDTNKPANAFIPKASARGLSWSFE
jgi:hypothetical protein